MVLTEFTTYDEIRAALGVSVDEIEDATLGLDMYEFGLEAELSAIGDALAVDFATVAAIDEGTRTTNETKFYQAVKLFAPYAVAKQMLPGLPLLAPKSITDGKASVTRDSSAPYKETIKSVTTAFAQYRQLLEDRYGVYVGNTATTSLRPFLSVISPASDPVTGS
jgi:hypothetical protein